MKAKQLLSLIQKDYTTIAVRYNNDPAAQTYTFKALFTEELSAGDLVVVPSSGKFGFAICEVAAVHDQPQIDITAAYNYKWIVQKVNLTRYNSINAVEDRFEESINALNRKKAQAAALREFTEGFGEGSEERKMLDEILAENSNLASLGVIEHGTTKPTDA